MPRAALQNAAALTTALDSSNGQLPQLGGCAAVPPPEPQSPPPALPILTLPVLARLTSQPCPPTPPIPGNLGTLTQEAGHVGQFVCRQQGTGKLRDPPRPQQMAPWSRALLPGPFGRSLTQLRQAATHVPFPLRTCCRWRLGQGWSPDGVHDISIKGVTQCGSRTASGRAGVLPSLASAPPPGQPGSPGWEALRSEGRARGQAWKVLWIPASSPAGK